MYIVVVGPGFLQQGYKNISVEFGDLLDSFVNEA
tara:strand:- start:88 stop:189 length:102 start_codon:yes stop_codon:yes gene_type:complete